MATAKTETQVLIVGGGPVGLGLAAELGLRGIDCLLVEQGDGTIYTPRANTVNSRTMEFCRRWGIADAVKNSGTPPGYPSDVVYLTTLQGHEIARITRPTYGGNKPLATTPEQSQRCNQLWFDPILRKLAAGFPDRVAAVPLPVRNLRGGRRTGVSRGCATWSTDQVETVAAQYLVACCGGQSSVASALGIGMEGRKALSYNLNVFLKIPELWKHHDKGKAAFYFFSDAEGFNTILVELDGRELWNLGINQGTRRVPLEAMDIPGLIRRLFGPHVPYEIVSALPWTCHSIVATGFGQRTRATRRRRRAPACPDRRVRHEHRHGRCDQSRLEAGRGARRLGGATPHRQLRPRAPSGGATLRRRRPPKTCRISFDAPSLRLAGDDSAEGRKAREKLRDDILANKTKHFISDGLVLGYRYDPSPIIVPDGTPPPEDSVSRYTPTSRPGSRAPHAWLSEGKSTIDLFGRGFVLLRFGGAAEDALRFTAAAAMRKVPLEVGGCGLRPRSPRSTSAAWSWCGRTVTSPGAATPRPRIRSR